MVADPRCVDKKREIRRETKRVADYVVVGNYRFVESIEGMAERRQGRQVGRQLGGKKQERDDW